MPEVAFPGQDDDALLDKLQKWEREATAHWSDWQTEAKTCYDMVAGEQWSSEDKAELDLLMRPYVTFNVVAPVIDSVSGAEISNRQQVTYLPRQVGASAANEVLTKGAEWIRDRCDAEQEESDAALDMFICGIGTTDTRMDYEDEPDGKLVIERCDPLEFRWDPSSRKKNFSDARYVMRRKPYTLADFEAEFPGASPDGGSDDGTKRPTIVAPEVRYTNGIEGDPDADTVFVDEFQWFDREPYYRVAHPDTGEVLSLSPDQYEPIAEEAAQYGVSLGGVRQIRKVFYKAFVAAGQVLDYTKLEVGEFTYKAMTGKRDRKMGAWYGLVRGMDQPQRYKNKFYSQMLHILNSNAKGGLLMEEDAVEDIREFESSYASADQTTWLKSGALSNANGPKFKEKTPPAYPASQDRMMQTASQALQEVTGVNQEMLGLADRDQPGVLEHQRKQAVYGILSWGFDAIKLYRKQQGRLMLREMQLYLPPSTLVRIVGDDGLAQYVPLALNDQTLEFDVIVDDAPAGPNQKEATWQMILQILPVLQNADLGPDVWAEFVRFSPFPNELTEKIIQALNQKAQQAGQPSPEQQTQMMLAQAKAKNDSASADHHSAQASLLQAKAMETMHKPLPAPEAPPPMDLQAEVQQSQINLNRVKASSLEAKTMSDIIRDHRDPSHLE